MHPLNFASMHGLNIDRRVLKPSDIIGHQMDILTASATHQDHSIVVGMLGEGTDGFGVAFRTGETQHVELPTLGLHSRNTVHYRNRSRGIHNLDLLVSH